jgi:hypothetical protein
MKRSLKALLTVLLLTCLFSGTVSAAGTSLPSSFDLRVKGVITPVKQQRPWGTCWGFAATAASEGSILTDLGMTYGTGKNQIPLDLSEKQLAWFAKTPLSATYDYDDPCVNSQRGEGAFSISAETAGPTSGVRLNTGGSQFLASSVYAMNGGALLEKAMPYSTREGVTGYEKIHGQTCYCYKSTGDWSVDENKRFLQSVELRDTAELPTPAQYDADGNYSYNANATELMKDEVSLGYPVEIAYHYDLNIVGINDPDGEYMNMADNRWAQYTWNTDASVNHAVCVVGWDDNYPRENFLSSYTDASGKTHKTPLPPADGAWLIKNSHGRGSGTGAAVDLGDFGVDEDGDGFGDGYFWLSYYDKTITDPECFFYDVSSLTSHKAKDANQVYYYDLYQYDLMPPDSSVSLTELEPETAEPHKVQESNVFTMYSDENIYAVAYETKNLGVQTTCEIYLLNSGWTVPTDGKLLKSITTVDQFGGYHRAEFKDSRVRVKKGQQIAVVVTEKDGDSYDAPVHYSYSRDTAVKLNGIGWGDTYGIAVVNPKESWYNEDGSWTDFSSIKSELETMDIPISSDGEVAGTMVYDNFPIKVYSDPS